MEEFLIQNIRFTNKIRFLLFFFFLIFSLFSKLLGISLAWSVIEIFALFLLANFISEISAAKIWPEEKAPQINSSYFAHQLIEIFLIFEIGYLTHPLFFFLLAIFYIIFSYFAFDQRVYSRTISLILLVGYFSFGGLAYFQILDYYFPNFFLNFSLTLAILICSLFFGENLLKSSENIRQALKEKTEELKRRENQQFQREEEFRRSRAVWQT